MAALSRHAETLPIEPCSPLGCNAETNVRLLIWLPRSECPAGRNGRGAVSGPNFRVAIAAWIRRDITKGEICDNGARSIFPRSAAENQPEASTYDKEANNDDRGDRAGRTGCD